jgi:hypothetical protein
MMQGTFAAIAYDIITIRAHSGFQGKKRGKLASMSQCAASPRLVSIIS